MLKVLGILGSARVGGNTELLLQGVIEGAQSAGAEVEIVRLSDLEIEPCANCGGCSENGVCALRDDMQLLYDKLVTYDIILLASPIYFMGVSAWTKAFIDRCQCLWVRKYRLNRYPEKFTKERKGLFISVCGMENLTAFEGAKTTVKSFFVTLHLNYLGEFLYPGIDAQGDIAKHPTALEDADKLGEILIAEFDNPDFDFIPEHLEKKADEDPN